MNKWNTREEFLLIFEIVSSFVLWIVGDIENSSTYIQ